MTAGFPSRLVHAIRAKGTPCCVGLDPRLDHLPEPFLSRVRETPTAASAADVLIDYHRAFLDVVAPAIPVVKPQAAFFEQLGSHGWRALEAAIVDAQERGLLVLLDVKRGDIGSTAHAYAAAALSGGELLGHSLGLPAADAVTVNPYLGTDSIQPFLDAAQSANAGLFVLAKTSNPSATEFQDHGEPPLSTRVAAAVNLWGEPTIDETGFSSVGAVVGATRPDELAYFRRLMPHAFLLLPGFGFQGGTADGVLGAFREDGLGALISASRSILWAHERDDLAHLADWQDRVAFAVREMTDAIGAVVSVAS